MEQKKLVLVGAALVAFLLSGCFGGKTDTKQQSLYLVNVLDKSFFDDCHIPGSLNISMMDIKKEAAAWSKDADVVIYCSNYSCEASTHCCKMLQKMGFTAVWDYEEGMAGWYQAHLKDPEGYPVAGACKEKYLTMENKPLVELEEDAKPDVKMITTEQLRALIERNSAA